VHGDGDGWVTCERGHPHWGRYGAAGLLLRDRARDGAGERDRVVLQHRAAWSHQGGTWGMPGGARDSDESAVRAALREAAEEGGLDPAAVRPVGLLTDDHGGWSYVTVLAEPVTPVEPHATGGESVEVRWVDVPAVDTLPLHPGFAATWPRLRTAPPGIVLVVDAANVVGARGRGDGWWRDRAGATRRLRDALAPLAEGLPAADLPGASPADVDLLLPRIVLVVEGAAAAVAADRRGGDGGGAGSGGAGSGGAGPGAVEVVAASGSGDDAIVAVAAAESATHRVLVVTADRGLADRLAALGVPRVGPRWLLSRIDRERQRG